MDREPQRVRLITLLREGVSCSWDLAYREAMPHASSRIPELNDCGWSIEGITRKWEGERNGRGEPLPAHAHYFIRREPAPRQLTLTEAA